MRYKSFQSIYVTMSMSDIKKAYNILAVNNFFNNNNIC